MTFDLLVPSQLLGALFPDLVLMVGAMVLMLQAAWRPDSAGHQRRVGINAMVLVVLTIAAVVYMIGRGDTAEGGVIAVDGFRWAVDLVILLAALGTIALSIEYNAREGIHQAEMHVLVLFAAAGMMILAAGRDLMIIFLGIEIMSVAAYVLAGLNRRSPRAAEAAIKYFLLGAFATGFLLYGIALIYGATGSTQLGQIGARIAAYSVFGSPMLLVGIGLLTIGFGFKVAAVPFHMWAPDVYDGAPTPITAFMAAAVKSAAFASFARIWYESFQLSTQDWAPILWWLAVVTMVVGNVVALAQRNIKRLLAYSSIAHTGYLLVAVLAYSPLASSAFIFYAVAYTLATFGAFAVISTLEDRDGRPSMLADYAGLWHVRPWLATAMAVYLLALLGFPIFGGVGFFAKWYLLQAALSSVFNLNALAVIVVLTSVISAGYYLQVVRVMFMERRPEGAADTLPAGPLTRTVLAVTTVIILGLGLFPGTLARWSQAGAIEEYRGRPVVTEARAQVRP
ncbi:MAG: NADH-quinone oxidoreductase subunit N [Gemmatimonadaceae bacterium]